MKTKISNKGFTLIEVLLVITLIGILLTIGLVNFNAEDRFIEARNDTRKTHIQTLESAITQYKLQEDIYPTGLSRTYQEICDPDSTSCTGFIDLKSSLVPNFLQAIPQDPNDTDNTGGVGYEIAVDDATNTVSVRSLQAEGEVIININDPLPVEATVTDNTPLVETVPKFPIVTDGLVLYLDAGNKVSYPGTGTTWFDLSGNNNNGTLVNGVGFSSNNGGGLVFDGVNDYLNLNSVSLLPVGTSDRTIVAFVKTPTVISGKQHVLHYGTSISNQAFGLVLSDGRLSTHTWGTNYGQGIIMQKEVIYYLVVSYTNSSALHKFWVNGLSQGAGVVGAINTGTTTGAKIGSRVTNSESWGPDGIIYNIMVYNRSLNDSEIQQNFNAKRGRFGL
jgi:prepilin-type N-terminal cleavage/methylation domain-containing protein